MAGNETVDEALTSAERRQRRAEADLEKVSGWLVLAFFFGWLAVIVRMATAYHYVAPGTSSAALKASDSLQAFAWSLACVAAGFGAGFLFGIPKSVARSDDAADGKPSMIRNQSGLRVNTNLEDISDWLTKVLVGATLTQVAKIPGAVRNASAFMAGGDGDKLGMSMYAAILIYFSLLGFLAGYILTRLFFGRAFAIADQETDVTSRLIVKQVEQEVKLGG
jgi:hypothetical protein